MGEAEKFLKKLPQLESSYANSAGAAVQSPETALSALAEGVCTGSHHALPSLKWSCLCAVFLGFDICMENTVEQSSCQCRSSCFHFYLYLKCTI